MKQLTGVYIPVRRPELTVVCVYDPRPDTRDEDRIRFFVLPGFNFGLVSAVLAFNSFPRAMIHFARLLLGVPCDHFYDDAVVVDITEHATSAQVALRLLFMLVGVPFADDKHKEMRAVGPYLGIITDLSSLEADGVVRLRIKPERQRKLIRDIEVVLQSGILTSGDAGKLEGKLMFASSPNLGK